MGLHPRFVAAACLFWVLVPSLLLAGAQDASRQEEIQAQRIEKAANPALEKRSWLESGILWVEKHKFRENLLTSGDKPSGIRPKIGGLSVTGPALGAQFERPDVIGENSALRLTGWLSTRKYQLYELQLEQPELFDGRAFFSGGLGYRNQPQLNFFGLGGQSTEPNRSDFLLEDMAYAISGGVRPMRQLRIGSEITWLQINLGSGTESKVANTEINFDDTTAPGLNEDPDFLRTGVFAEFDSRDEKGNPRSGGYYRLDYAFYNDWRLKQFDFRRLHAELHQYIPFTQGHRVIAARFAVSFDDPLDGRRVPFYLQRTLGGPDDLRGFRPFRFRDLNQMLMTAEYRWKAWAGLDLAAFADAGKVFERRGDFGFNDLEASYGIGFRLNTRKTTLIRLDAARSREGIRVFAGVGATFD